jgi:hypothetical protein
MRAAVSSGFSSGKKCPPFKRATLGQQKQHWAFESLAGSLIDAIVFDVDRYFPAPARTGVHCQTGTLGLKHPEAAMSPISSWL